VTGGLAMMTGLLLALISAMAGPSFLGGRTPVSLVASGLIVAGLFCGVTLIAVTAPGSRRSRARARTGAPAPVSAPHPASAPVPVPARGDPPGGHHRGVRRRRGPGPPRPREPDPSEEWMDALRPPGPPPITGPLPVVRPPPPATPAATSDHDP
jgi:hypothetical protein